jgi:RimJ/RimL family protein N-acetyltransferase
LCFRTTPNKDNNDSSIYTRLFRASETPTKRLANGEVVSLGNRTLHKLNPDVASIGMIVTPKFRRQGYGSHTIAHLTQICVENGLTVQAGCWLYNHASRKTLQKGGLATANLIVRVDEF